MADPLPLKEEDVYVIPATTEKTYDKMWISSIVIDTPSPTVDGSITIVYFPMNAIGEVVRADSNGRSLSKSLNLSNIFEAAGQIPELAQAYGAFLAAVKPVEAFIGGE